MLRGGARVAIQPAGEIDSQAFYPRGVDLIDHRVQRRTRFAPRAGAEQSIDDPIRAGELLLQAGDVVSVAEQIDRYAALSQDCIVRRCVAGQFGFLGPYENVDSMTTQIKMPGDYKTIARVVPFAATDDDPPQRPAKLGLGQAAQDIGDAAAGILHEHEAGHAVLLDRAAIDFAGSALG